MGIKTQKVLRLISKIILILVGVGLVGIAGYCVYKSIAFKPQNVIVTNITDGSATVTWTTTSPMKGIVYVKKDKGLLPGPLGIIGSSMAYDDRDVSDAQKACVDAFNKKASETKDSTFSVSGSNFDCENVKVTKTGSYYTHSVTMTNLDENSTYNFVVGDGIWSFKESVSTVKTFSVLDSVGEPMPVFGKITGDDGTYSRDAIVYITFNDGSESKDSIVYSSAVNDDGGWYVDASAIRDVNGNVLPLELTNDSFKAKGIYQNYGISEQYLWVLGYFNSAYPDIVVKKAIKTSLGAFDRLVMGVYATDCETLAGNAAKVCNACANCSTYLSTSEINAIANGAKIDGAKIGYGNAAKITAALNGGTFKAEDLTKIGLGVNAGNLNALVSTGVETFKVDGDTTGMSINYSNGQVASVNVPSSTPSDDGTSTPIVKVPTETGSLSDCNKNLYSDGCGIYCDSHPNVGACRKLNDPNYCNNSVCRNITPNTYETCTSNVKSTHSGQCPGSGTCSDRIGTHKIGDSCDNGLTCTVTGCNGVSATSQEKCSVIAKYNNRGDLSSCTMSCNGGEINVGSNKCLSILPPDNKDIPQSTEANFSTERTTEVLVSEISLGNLAKIPVRLEELVNSSPKIKENVQNELKALADAHNNDFAIWTFQDFDTYWGYCKSLGGDPDSTEQSILNANQKLTCEGIPGASNIKGVFDIAKAYAAETTDATNSYTLYMPEYGMYSFQLGDYTMSSSVSDGKTLYLFYVEANGKSGFQMPADPDNPTSEEDIVLSSSASEITYTQESTAQQYEIKKGINIISFNFVPVSTDTGAYTAKDVISQALENGVEIQYISTFEGGRWNSGYSCSSGTCTGNNFTIVPGKGYLVYATQDGTVTIPGYNLTSSVPVAFSAGWNLVGVHGYTTAYTARSFIDSINTIEGLTANNVSWWPTSKSKYEGVEVDNGKQYGLDFSISPNNGYFVRISKFAPTDTKCKSLIWNAGGSLNGTCGNTK